MSISEALRILKSNSSGWIHDCIPGQKDFAWQSGYATFSVSYSNLESVRKYIQNQEAHHRKSTFKEELIALLKKHDVEYDERYLCD
jgi:REP-associated tyrosine transposase